MEATRDCSENRKGAIATRGTNSVKYSATTRQKQHVCYSKYSWGTILSLSLSFSVSPLADSQKGKTRAFPRGFLSWALLLISFASLSRKYPWVVVPLTPPLISPRFSRFSFGAISRSKHPSSSSRAEILLGLPRDRRKKER